MQGVRGRLRRGEAARAWRRRWGGIGGETAVQGKTGEGRRRGVCGAMEVAWRRVACAGEGMWRVARGGWRVEGRAEGVDSWIAMRSASLTLTLTLTLTLSLTS